jgi:hypothetical protein
MIFSLYPFKSVFEARQRRPIEPGVCRCSWVAGIRRSSRFEVGGFRPVSARLRRVEAFLDGIARPGRYAAATLIIASTHHGHEIRSAS